MTQPAQTMVSQLALVPDWVHNMLDPMMWLNRFGDAALWGAALIIFIECGLFIFMLPGDSLLFTVGLLVGIGTIKQSLTFTLIVLMIAAFAGNVAGYTVGSAIGPRLFSNPNSKFLTPANIEKTHAFFEKYGPRAIILARLVPIVRTFITLVAGVGQMNRTTFFTYSGIGAVLWVGIIVSAGYALGDNAWVQANLEKVLLGIVFVSILPMIWEFFKARQEAKAAH